MANWLDVMLGRVREAPTMDAARLAIKDYIDPATGEKREGVDGDNDTHIHLHMNGKEGARGMDDDPDLDPDNNGEPDSGDLAAQVAELTQRVAQLEALMQEEEDVELEGENEDGTKDARRFKLRRGKKLSTRDEGEDIPVPERREDIVGETDLPGIEDLDKRMATATADQKRRARSNILRTRDSADQEDLWKETMSAAEIIVPGIRVPTFDARLPMGRTGERLCAFRRRTLEQAFKDDATSAVIADVVGIKTADGLKPLACDTVKMAFNAAAGAMRTYNTAGTVRTSAATRTADSDRQKGPPSLAEMNKHARELWSKEKTNGASRH